MTFTLQLSGETLITQPRLTPPASDTHKYLRGHAVVMSGPELKTGASRLCARAALAIGAGLVTILGDRPALCEHAAHVTAIMLKEKDAALSAIDDRVRAVAVGPGAGTDDSLRISVLQLLALKKPVLLDADALTVFAGDNTQLFSALSENDVMTPHLGEFARLFPDIATADPVAAAVEAARRSGAVILLKGPHSVIAAPTGRYAINRHSSPWLATAGSGDILSGMICGLLAQGVPAFDAAAIAAWLHGDIGVRAGAGLTADRMTDYIPLVLQSCLQEGSAKGV
jgi:hydroxyethylthiazole kinase-like uncharacterized protein yjeF